jgi:peroxiredoxin
MAAAPEREIDALGALAYGLYVALGGFLVFAFAWSLMPAIAKQNEATCKGLNPDPRSEPSREEKALIEAGKLGETVGIDARLAEDGTLEPWQPPKPGELAPDFVGLDLEGNEVRLSDFRGKVVVLNFWATWCPPCITEWPQVHQLAERLAEDDDVVVIALSVDEEPSVIAPFLATMALEQTHVKVLWDPEPEARRKTNLVYGTTKMPDTYVIDELGVLRHVFVNSRKWGSPSAIQCVESMVGR